VNHFLGVSSHTINLYATSPKSHLCKASFSAPTAVANPQAIVDFRGGKETEPASGWPKERFLTPEPDEDFVDPVDEYKMPWEEDTPLPEGVRSKAGDASSYAASIGLEISGSEEFVTDACAFVLEFRDIFSTELSPEPADLPPLDVLLILPNDINLETRGAHATNRWKDNRRLSGIWRNS
jgi:hypothetical protein